MFPSTSKANIDTGIADLAQVSSSIGSIVGESGTKGLDENAHNSLVVKIVYQQLIHKATA